MFSLKSRGVVQVTVNMASKGFIQNATLDFQRSFSKIGFIGLGNMGNPMVKNLMKKGHKVAVYDIKKDSVADLAKAGATGCGSVAEAVDGADAVVTMLPASKHVLDTYTRKGGILESVKKGAYLVDSSTVDPSVSQTLAPLAKEKGATYLDGPVSGGTIGAEAGTLTFMIGGEEDASKKVEPLLLCMGGRVVYCGSHGMGLVAKIANNMLLGISMLGVSEAMNLGIKLGMDPKTLMSILNTSTGRCWSSEMYNPVPGMLPNVPSSNGYKGGFGVALIAKDLGIAQSVATQSGIAIPMGAQAHQMYRMMEIKKLGDKDLAVAYKYLQGESV
ncbi:3-hydroxyisobutyrate dehydrogenase, mitochondrial [Thrips palmi]|uniref:3-hydroxyisobutyrate dehydrogenase n=1 Tax=Thrips palmi TaxID=161013 RepID=A0A6P8YTS8_THRPL|nr:3-hydroxyisobutyrate dehydrogenase, mitochondrial [Thrips palmi]